MGDGTSENPYTREDVLRLIEENRAKAKGLDLSGKVFEEGIDLCGLDLSGIILNGAYLSYPCLKGANLEGANLEMTTLWEANLEGANLMYAQLKGADLTHVHLKGANLQGASLEEANLIGAHLEGAIFVGAYLVGADLRTANLAGAYLGAASLDSSTKLENVNWGDHILDEERSRSLDWAADSYRQLKKWYTDAGMYDVAAKFYYREKEVNRKGLKLCSKHWNDRLAAEFMRLLFGYGERWQRIFIWIAVVIFGLATAYYFLGSFSSSSFLDTLYYSATSFTALGYGKWAPQPIGWAKGMGAAEAVIGVFMMALLLVTFVRKWTR